MHPLRSALPLLSLCALLGACGGGGGSTATDASPSAVSGTATPTQTSDIPSPSPAGPTSLQPSTQPISATGVDGAVLATMLMQNTFSTGAHDARMQPVYQMYGAVAWNANAQAPIEPPDAPTAFGYQYFTPETQEPAAPARYYTASFITNFQDFTDFGRFTDIRTQIPLQLHLTLETQAASVFLFSTEAVEAAAAGQNILSVGPQAEITAQVRAPRGHFTTEYPGAQNWALQHAGSAYALKQGLSHPYEKALLSWQDGQDNQLQLLLMPGSSADRAQLCFRHQLANARRLSCSLWRLPANWSFGQRLQYEGVYIDDDRSVHPDGSGHRYWRTAPAS